MFYGIGQLLADFARDASEDKTGKATFSVAHAALSLGAAVHNLRTLTWSARRAREDLKVAFPTATARVSEAAARARTAA